MRAASKQLSMPRMFSRDLRVRIVLAGRCPRSPPLARDGSQALGSSDAQGVGQVEDAIGLAQRCRLHHVVHQRDVAADDFDVVA